jgi:pantoate kinase
MHATAFVPGHISAFFEPVYIAHDLDRTGSRGAGLSLSLGTTSTVTLTPAKTQEITITLNGKTTPAPVTTLTCKHLLTDSLYHASIKTTSTLPESQGFGMSAAGAFSTALALARLLAQPHSDALRAAHYAEIQMHTGLGDVIATTIGGIEIRRQPGLPPWGMLEHIPGQCELVLCVVGEKIKTKDILTDQTKFKKIATIGKRCTQQLLQHPSLENLFRLGQRFTKDTGLASDNVQAAIDAAAPFGLASMCMLGNSVFATGNTPMLRQTLEAFGNVWVCTLDLAGARLID